MKSLTQTLTEVYEGFKLRKEKQRLEEFVDSMGGFTLMCVYGENKKYLPCACGCSECYTERFPALPGCGMPTFSNAEAEFLKKNLEKPWIGNPGPWEPIGNFGINGPGYGRVLAPGLIERQRLDDHPPLGPHFNKELYSIFNNRETKSISNEHCTDLKDYLK